MAIQALFFLFFIFRFAMSAELHQQAQLKVLDPDGIAQGLPDLPDDMVWHQYPWHPDFVADPEWHDTLGVNMARRRFRPLLNW
jgi:hypothetical protein